MKRKTISQADARRLKARVHQLEGILDDQRNCYLREYPGGVHIGTIELSEMRQLLGSVWTARKLDHAVVVSVDGTRIQLYALQQPKAPA